MKFEYKVVDNPNQDQLYLLGQKGWELVSVIVTGMTQRYFFKRTI